MNHGMHVGGGHPPYHGGGRGRGGRGTFGGRGGHNVPPHGSMPIPPAGWYNNNDLNNPPASPSGTPGDTTSTDPQHVVVVLGDGPSNSTNVATVEGVGVATSVPGKDDQNVNVDPLSSMDPLRQNLPDIRGVTAPAVPGEN